MIFFSETKLIFIIQEVSKKFNNRLYIILSKAFDNNVKKDTGLSLIIEKHWVVDFVYIWLYICI